MSELKNSNLETEQRDQFQSKAGFILACIGSAIGMGNIWLFPWRVGKYGGAAFLIPYFIFVFLLGTTGLMGEFSFGRMAKKGPIGAFEHVFKKRNKSEGTGTLLGLIPVLGATGVAIGYAIVVGWVLKYLVGAIKNDFATADIPAYFGGFVTSTAPIPWHLLAIIITIIILVAGIANGIEKVNKIVMPAFFVLFAILIVRVVTLPNAMEGIRYLLVPDWSLLLQPITWVMALGQAFFTVSLGGSGMLVYGSYLKKDVDVKSASVNTVFFDTLGAMMAAFVVIPAVFAFGLDPAAGPPLLFISLPMVFQQMPMGALFGILFFAAIFFAAISSLINLMEVPMEAVADKFKITRKKAGVILVIACFAIGLLLDLAIIDLGAWMDAVTIYIVPLGAIVAAIVFFWVYGMDDVMKEINMGAAKPVGDWFKPFAKYVFTIIAVAIFILGIALGGIG